MTYPAPDKVPYDPWFDDNIPSPQYGSMQCWIATEDTAQWSTVFDATVHSLSLIHISEPTRPY